MMNLFKTGPRFILAYNETRKLAALGPRIEKLREAGDIEGEKALIHMGQARWLENASRILGLSYDLKGEENVPSAEDGPFMIYSNHQGFADIPATLRVMRDHGMLGYVSKAEWRKYKILADIINYTRSVLLTRDNPKEALRAISEVKHNLDLGFNMIIFPEGTRSKGGPMGEFKAGAFKFAEKAKVPILPVSVDGSYKMFEEKGSWQPCHIRITVHPLVHIEEMDRAAQKEAQKQIEETVRSALARR